MAVEVELPSGVKVLARKPAVLQLATWGKLPMGLAAAASGEAAGGDVSREVAELAGFYRDLLVYCLVKPRISVTPAGEDEIHPREIPVADWNFLVSWALRVEEVRALDGFREGRADAGGGGDGEAVFVAAV